MKMISPSGKVTVDVHPSRIESMKNSGYSPAVETPAKKRVKNIKLKGNHDGNA
tara:strand:+ start:1210 stop:1368 length:159 start_codon:yes stop_codon:yes gene_type:complete